MGPGLLADLPKGTASCRFESAGTRPEGAKRFPQLPAVQLGALESAANPEGLTGLAIQLTQLALQDPDRLLLPSRSALP